VADSSLAPTLAALLRPSELCAFAPASVGALSSLSMPALCFFSLLHGLSTGDNAQ
jgi:hypothetical protein